MLDDRGIDRAVLAGASMGAHTIVRLALDHGDRVAGVALVTPAYTPEGEHADLARWDALSDGLRDGRRGRASSPPTATPACPRRGATP